LRIINQQLRQKLDEEPSIAESARHLLQIFFRSRGRNFILACAAFAAFWLAFHRLYRWVKSSGWFQRKRRRFSLRLFDVIYKALTILGAVFIFLLVLYLFKDWVLLTLAILFLLGLAWTSKQTLPHFVREVTLLLNLGAVREGERVIYNGIPWLVRSLNFYTRLVNPELEGGDIRLPLRDFHNLRSRSFDASEPWFPTRLNDWVLMDEQTLGKVVLQTPEIVRLVLLGGSRKTFSTSDFLAQSPHVLSTGFRLGVTFGIDYQHQAIITAKIPTLINSALHEALDDAGYKTHLANLSVEFAEAGASSLDIEVLADFSGAAAPQYFVLRRAIQRICVDACNANGWVIPFTQLTLHVASPNGKTAVPMLTDTAEDAL
jgi:small-conductance mechanosensitive channel